MTPETETTNMRKHKGHRKTVANQPTDPIALAVNCASRSSKAFKRVYATQKQPALSSLRRNKQEKRREYIQRQRLWLAACRRPWHFDYFFWANSALYVQHFLCVRRATLESVTFAIIKHFLWYQYVSWFRRIVHTMHGIYSTFCLSSISQHWHRHRNIVITKGHEPKDRAVALPMGVATALRTKPLCKRNACTDYRVVLTLRPHLLPDP